MILTVTNGPGRPSVTVTAGDRDSTVTARAAHWQVRPGRRDYLAARP